VIRSEATKNEQNQDLDAEEAEEEEELYERFIRGEPMDEDDEDFEYYPSETERNGSTSPTSSRSEHGNDEEEEEEIPRQDANETVSLFSDLSSAPSAMTSASVLVAHMTHNSPLPMTRQRFQHLMSAPSHRSDSLLSDWSDVAAIRRSSSSGTGIHEDSHTETGRNCVVCTVEPRQIICWPCRWVTERDFFNVTLSSLADVSRCVMTAAKILHRGRLHLLTRVLAVEESEYLYWAATKLHLTSFTQAWMDIRRSTFPNLNGFHGWISTASYYYSSRYSCRVS
jgi:hypothetical protein